MITSVFDRVENIVGKGENAGYQYFHLFSQCFQKTSFLRSLKVGIVWQSVKALALLLTVSQMTNFRLFQSESVCRWQCQILWR